MCSCWGFTIYLRVKLFARFVGCFSFIVSVLICLNLRRKSISSFLEWFEVCYLVSSTVTIINVVYFPLQVLPSLREKNDELLLSEFVRRWANHKYMVSKLSLYFHYLSRYFIPRRGLPSLEEVGYTCFRDMVCFQSSHLYAFRSVSTAYSLVKTEEYCVFLIFLT